MLRGRAATDSLGKLSLTTRLRKAVENQNWELHYQPIVDLSRREAWSASRR